MSYAGPVLFTCVEVGESATQDVVATQTHRASYIEPGAHLEWQFYIELLGLILVRRPATEDVSIDDPARLFRSGLLPLF